ncbi:MAG: sugar phosphate isomerase/epimerase [Bacteroidetes bacterium]|nr:MAG: sugar phosphate isomerase/epimerase [Bacteroidota bacterium]
MKRRTFLQRTTLGAVTLGLPLFHNISCSAGYAKSKMKMGLVTYLWGKDMDIPTLISSCQKSGLEGVELRVEHAHGVMPNISAQRRAEVKRQFEDSGIELVGLGTNQQYDYPDPDVLRKSIEGTKEFIILSNDVGGSGVKVKPNAFHEDVPRDQTLEQIGKSLREIAEFAADYGQEIRLEVHGKETNQLPNIKIMMEVADHPNVRVCWNCNDADLNGPGLKYNFNLVKDYFGNTVHIRELNVGEYPYQQLMDLLVEANYSGWILLECRTEQQDYVAAMAKQLEIFKEMVAISKNKVK